MENMTVERGANKTGNSVSMDGGGSAIARRNAHVIKHHTLVAKVAKRLARRLPAHISIDDLTSAGMLGLLEAAERFDPERGQKFESFAEFRIRGAIWTTFACVIRCRATCVGCVASCRMRPTA